MRGVAYALVPAVLQKYGLLKKIEKVAGSSAGSIVATVIALKYTPKEIEEIFDTLKFDEFSDNVTYTQIVFNFLTSSGINSGEYFEDWIQHIIRMKTGTRYTTFTELYELTSIELVITGTNVSTGTTEYFSHKTTPNMTVWLAVRISISIPVFFKSVIYNDNEYIDGGVLSNYPIWIFDDPDTYVQGEVDMRNAATRKHRQLQTLGFKLIPETLSRGKSSNNPYYIPVISMAVRLIYLLVNFAYVNCDTYQAAIRTVYINTMNVGSTAFSLSDEMKDQLKMNGEMATEVFLTKNRLPKKSNFDMSQFSGGKRNIELTTRRRQTTVVSDNYLALPSVSKSTQSSPILGRRKPPMIIPERPKEI
jgi:NTE family protein